MATALTFSSLETKLRAYNERGGSSDPTVEAEIPSFINLAEREIARALKIQGFINVVTSTMAAGTSVYAKPDRWRDTVSINFGVGVSQVRTPLFPRSYEYCRTYWPDEGLRAQPEFYADYDYHHWLISPTPDSAYPFEVLYYQLPALLSAANQTNWTTDYAPNALLDASMLQMLRFLKDWEGVKEWQPKFDRDLAALNGEDLEKILDRTSTRQEA